MSVVARALRWLTSKMDPPRVIYDQSGEHPYLSRYYIFGRPHMPDGSAPFNKHGNPKPEVVWPKSPMGLYLHRFHRGDGDPELHNHPWRWAVSLILSGGYSEERRQTVDPGGTWEPAVYRIIVRCLTPGMLNFIDSDDFHRVDLLADEAWSLFLVGPKFSGWGFWNRQTGAFTDWREFINARRDPTAFARPS